MNRIFLTILTCLIVFTQFILFRDGKRLNAGGGPILYWATGVNAARLSERNAFMNWAKKNHDLSVDLQLDPGNVSLQKVIVQAVSGVADPIMDIYPGNVQYLSEMGILENLGPLASQLGISLSNTFPDIADDISSEGVQYGYPANIGISSYYANVDTFLKYGLAAPPDRWDIDTFSKIGREFTRRANASGKKDARVFFANRPGSFENIRRIFSVSLFNETLTGPNIENQNFIEGMETFLTWINTDKLIPTQADLDSMTASGSETMNSSWGFTAVQLAKGNIAMIHTGKWAAQEYRQLKLTNLKVVEMPHNGFPNALIFARTVCLYRGAPDDKKKLAETFYRYLSTEEYNLSIFRDGEGFPLNPIYLDHPDFLNPKDHPEEAPHNKKWREIATTMSIGGVYSPYILPTKVQRLDRQYLDFLLNGQLAPKETARAFAKAIREEVESELRTKPELKPKFRQALERQEKIDALKKRGEKIPAGLIDNVFLKKLLRSQGALI